MMKPKNKIIDLYNRVAADYGQVGPRILDVFGRALVQFMGISAGARVLDVGCGRGASLLPTADVVRPDGLAVGTDIAWQMVWETQRECQRRELTKAHLLQMDGDYLAFGSSSFDYILCGFAIFLFPQPERTLQGWYHALDLGGKLGICVASSGDERWQWYEALLWQYHKQYHFPLSANVGGLRKPKEIKALMEKTGFNQVERLSETYEFAYADAAQWWQTKWTHGARFPLEQMGEEVLTQFKADVFKHLQQGQQSDELCERWQLAYIIGTKG